MGRKTLGVGHSWRTLGVHAEGNCQYCGKSIVMWRSDRKYCSDACGDKARKNVKPREKVKCKGCRAEFIPVRRQEYHSKECREAHYESQFRRKNRARVPKIERRVNDLLRAKW